MVFVELLMLCIVRWSVPIYHASLNPLGDAELELVDTLDPFSEGIWG